MLIYHIKHQTAADWLLSCAVSRCCACCARFIVLFQWERRHPTGSSLAIQSQLKNFPSTCQVSWIHWICQNVSRNSEKHFIASTSAVINNIIVHNNIRRQNEYHPFLRRKRHLRTQLRRGKSGPALGGMEYRLMPSACRLIVQVKFTISIPRESCTNPKAKYSSSVVPPDPSVHFYHRSYVCQSIR